MNLLVAREHRPLVFAVLALTLLAAAWYLFVTWTQWASNHTYLADVGVFNALSYGPLYGHWMRTPLAPDAAGNYFGIHVQPYLFFLTPFYFVLNHPMTLLGAMALHVAVAALPWAAFVFTLTRSRVVTLAFTALYLGNHFTLSIHLANHPESFALPWLFAMFLASQRRAWRFFFPSLVLALMVKEDLALWLGLWCVTLLFERDTRRMGAVACALCAVWFVAAQLVMRACGYEEFQALGMTPVSRFASMGSSTGGIAVYALTHPHVIAGRLLREPLFLLILCSGILCLIDWRTLWVGVLGAAAFMATDDVIIGRLDYYYSYASFPFFLYSSARGARWLLDRSPERPMLHRGLAACFLLIPLVSFCLPTRTDGLLHRPFEVTPRHRMIGQVLAAELPPQAAVAAQYDLYNRVPHRAELFGLREVNLDRVEYIVIDLQGRAPDLTGAERTRVSDRISSDEWQPIYNLEGIVILRKVAP